MAKNFVVYLAWLLVLAGCDDRAEPAAAARAPTAESAEKLVDATIRMSTTSCRGRCPVYTVSISGDGKVVFTGKDHVARFGRQERSIDPASVSAILSKADEVGFFDITPEWLEDTCKARATDLSTTRLAISTSSKSASVSDYHGCAVVHPFEDRTGPRDQLRELQTFVRDTAIPGDWLKPQ